MGRFIRRRRTAFALSAAVAALLLCAPGAFASTVASSGTDVSYDAALGIDNVVTLTEPTTGTIVITTTNDPVTTTPLPTNCTDTSGGAGTQVTCTGITDTVTANGEDGNDTIDASGVHSVLTDLIGGDGNDVLSLGAFDNGTGCLFCGTPNTADGGAGDDTLNGGPGADYLTGGAGNDTLNGGAGDDYVSGGDGNDIVNGGAGDDYLSGDDGNDALNGGAGNDNLAQDPGTDTLSGGAGIDTADYSDQQQVCNPTCTNIAMPVNVSLDGNANDGWAGENDNVETDVEDVYVGDCSGGSGCPDGGATLIGDAGMNALYGGGGNDTITGGGGNDFLYGGGGNDTINAVDGFADRVQCGDGTDTANVDQFDQVSDNCETVNRSTVGNANEDAPPSVSWVAPADNAVLSTKTPNTLQVNASDDKGVTQVVFMVGERVLCVVKAAPYTCSYQPQDVDLGRDTLVAIAYDASQQTASAVRNVKVPQFQPRITAKTSPKRDRRSPFRFRTTGKLTLPPNTTPRVSCVGGQVSIQFKAGKKTVSTRRANLRKDCTFSSRVTFHLPKRLHPRTLRVFVTFRGNQVLAPVKLRTYTVRVK